MNNLRETFVLIANSPELMVLLKTSLVIAAGLLFVWAYRSARASIRQIDIGPACNKICDFVYGYCCIGADHS